VPSAAGRLAAAVVAPLTVSRAWPGTPLTVDATTSLICDR